MSQKTLGKIVDKVLSYKPSKKRQKKSGKLKKGQPVSPSARQPVSPI